MRSVAIHTVFILKENILFLEEWIDYHMTLGFNKFYLYDNSKVNRIVGWDLKHKDYLIPGKVNKYKTNYDQIVNLTDKQMNEYMKKICDKYKCIEIIEWSPKDRNGNILYGQVKAHNECLTKLKEDNIDWCANIDMDEYIVLKKHNNIDDYLSSLRFNVDNVSLNQIMFESRFNHLDKRVIDITNCKLNTKLLSNKNLYRVKRTKYLEVHHWISNCATKHKRREIYPNHDEICFYHYKLTDKQDSIIDNINPVIKNQIKANAESYIPLK